jgi:hypothetical protein
MELEINPAEYKQVQRNGRARYLDTYLLMLSN